MLYIFTSLEKCTMSYISIIMIPYKSSFTAPKSCMLCLFTSPSYPPPTLETTDLFAVFLSFAFSRMSHSCSQHSMQPFQIGFFFTVDMHLRFLFPVFSWLDSSFLFALNNIPLSGCTKVYPSTYWRISLGSKLWIKLLKISMCRFLCDISFQLLWLHTKEHHC